MEFIADLHLHSRYSRATSTQLIPEVLDCWAGVKGIKVVGTGDFTHPGWLNELKEKLEPEGNGLFLLKKYYRQKPFLDENNTRFLLSGEISTIYKHDGKVRKIHQVIFTPGFEEAEKINAKLRNLGGNLTSDGRPILGLNSRNLLELILDCDAKNAFIPAHIWTPWFSVLGSRSGFDSMEECFGDYMQLIFAVETGLSTDAPMNWLCSFLDRYTLISNSDAHSPDRLGRNANIFASELSYSGITNALKPGHNNQFSGTIDLFPQEGKYHFDGHRKCGICWNPVQTIQNRGICPNCLKPVTIGVMNRIVQLSDREKTEHRPNRLPYYSIIPLKELIGEMLQVGENSKQVEQVYFQTIRKLGPELEILLKIPIDQIMLKCGEVLAEAITRMRNRQVIIREGYDGEYGKITVFHPGEVKSLSAGDDLFRAGSYFNAPAKIGLINFDLKGIQQKIKDYEPALYENIGAEETNEAYSVSTPDIRQDRDQAEAITYLSGPSFIEAGPGTGKTRTLTGKIAQIIREKIASPEQILAITFTNRAASEMRQRLEKILKEKEVVKQITISTFHAFGMQILRNKPAFFGRSENFTVIDEPIREEIVKKIPGIIPRDARKISRRITDRKNNPSDAEMEDFYIHYELMLKNLDAFDFDDLILKPLDLLRNNPSVLQAFQQKFRFVFIDEFQDTNQVQYELIRLLVPESAGKLCVVGDPNQSIYSFRGASSAIASRFFMDYPAARTFRLKTSYRCPQSILNASSKVIQSSKGFLNGIQPGVKISFSEQATDKSEAEFIAREIVKQMGGLSFFAIDSSVSDGYSNENSGSLSEIAILCRTKNQFPAFIKAFNDHNIPFQVVGDEPFYREEPFKDLLNLLHAISLYGTEQQATFLKLNNMNYFTGELEEFYLKSIDKKLPSFINSAAGTFFPPETFRNDDLKRLLYLSENKKTLHDFLLSLRMGTGPDTIQENQDSVFLMTIHASKGLEFNCVFIPGCEQGLNPYSLYKNEVDLAEERRLFYVAMTRVKRILYLSHANKRMLKNRSLSLPRSEFIKTIENELLNLTQNDYPKTKDKTDEQLKLF